MNILISTTIILLISFNCMAMWQHLFNDNLELLDAYRIFEYPEHKERIRSIAFSRDENLLVTGSDDGVICSKSIEAGKLMGICHLKSPVKVLSMNQNENQAFTADNNGNILQCDLTSGHILSRFDSHTAEITDLKIESAGKFIASSSIDGTVRVTNIETHETRIAALADHHLTMFSKFTSGTNGKIIVSSLANELFLFGSENIYGSVNLNCQFNMPLIILKAFNYNGKLVAIAADQDNQIVFLDIENRKIYTYPIKIDYVELAAFTTDNKYLVVTGSGKIHVYSMISHKLKPIVLTPYNIVANNLAISVKGRYIAINATNNKCYIWKMIQ